MATNGLISLQPLSLPPRSPARRAALRNIERALLTDGWLRLALNDCPGLSEHMRSAYAEAEAFLGRPDGERLLYERDPATLRGARPPKKRHAYQ